MMWDVASNPYGDYKWNVTFAWLKFVDHFKISGLNEENLEFILTQIDDCETMDGLGCGISDDDLTSAMIYASSYHFGNNISCTTYLKTNLVYDLQTNKHGLKNFTNVFFYDWREQKDLVEELVDVVEDILDILEDDDHPDDDHEDYDHENDDQEDFDSYWLSNITVDDDYEDDDHEDDAHGDYDSYNSYSSDGGRIWRDGAVWPEGLFNQRYYDFQWITSDPYPGLSPSPLNVDIMFQIVTINERKTFLKGRCRII